MAGVRWNNDTAGRAGKDGGAEQHGYDFLHALPQGG
jgi:hypothetical protein